MNSFLVRLFVILGPLGNILTPAVLPNAFRTYYFVLLGFPFLLNSLGKKQQKLLFLLTPALVYVVISSLCTLTEEPTSLGRSFLLLTQFLFVLGGASHINNQTEVLALYLKSFFLSLLINIGFFIGFYMGVFSFSTIERFSVLAQIGYGLLRFSIGSYPNEYGIVASFVASVLFLMMVDKKERLFSKTFTLIFLGLTIIALILTTTRSAYIACFISFFTIITFKKRALIWASTLLVVIVLLLKLFGVNLINFILFGFDLAQIAEGSMGSRLILWDEAVHDFLSHSFFGTGFASFADLHNVYLQLLVELGVVGCLLLIGALIIALCKRQAIIFLKPPVADLFSQRVRKLGLMHVLWFAMTNHNLNHHFTWLIILFYITAWARNEIVNKTQINYKFI